VTAKNTIERILFNTPCNCNEYTEDIESQLMGICRAISAVYTVFNNTSDEDMMEACIYQLKSLEAQHRALIKKCRLIKETA
jgi:hypothetical protein